MNLKTNDCCILNQGSGAWAFDGLARQLSAALRVPISTSPRRFNYLLNFEPLPDPDFLHPLFIPLPAVQLSSDKRLMAAAFHRFQVPTPRTILCETFAEVTQFVTRHPEGEWCLKYPTSCGGNGHRMVATASPEPPNWPRPWIVQEFVRLERPEVYRIYVAGGALFGWVVRRFPSGRSPSPWVAHAQGAKYERVGDAPAEALSAARAALSAAGLWDSFGCVDLLCRPSGDWAVLEVGTDGLFNHVDRELDNDALETELSERIAAAFWQRAEFQS